MPSIKEPINIAELIEPYAGLWVALSHDERHVVGTGTSIEIVLAEASKKGENHPVIIKSPDQYSSFLL